MEVKQLDEIVKKVGNTLKKVYENDYGYIYQEICPKSQEAYPNHEVFEKRKGKVTGILKTRKNFMPYDEMILYPSSEDWGTWAWTYRDLDNAKKKLSEIEGKAREDKK